MLVALAPVIATAVALTLYFTLLRYNDVEAALRQRGFAMVRQLSAASQYGLFSGNIVELNHLTQILAHEPDVSAITIYDQRNMPLVMIGKPLASPPPNELVDGWSERSKREEVLSFHNKIFASSLTLDDPYAKKDPAPAPVLMGSITIELSRDNLVARKREILLFTMGTALLILLIAGLIARRLGRNITEPVLALENAVNSIREGLLGTRVQPHTAGTLRTLEEGINAMAAVVEQVQKRSMEALISSNEQLQEQSDFANALLDAQTKAGFGLMIIDEGRLVYVNKLVLMFLRTTEDDMYQMRASSLLAPHQRESFERQSLRILQGETTFSRLEVNSVTPDGSADDWAELFLFEITRSNRRMVAVLAADITQRKHDAEQLHQAHEILQTQKEEAERASAAKSRFIAAASHDLRQPLHALALFSGQLQEHISTPAQSRLAGQIDTAIGNMSGLLESLLEISKLDLVTLRPEIHAIELYPLLEQIAATHWQSAENKHLRLTVARTSLRILSDPRYLTHIVTNLVSNAVRYTKQGTILIGARRAGDNIRIEIWDTGIGIDEKHITSLFQEFYQVDNPERDAEKGLGLGLSIVDRLAKLLGHKIGVRSIFGAGSVFSVLVPRAKAEDTRPAPVLPEKYSARMMLVIDNNTLQIELMQMLRQWGYTVLSCQASEVAQAFGPDPTPLDLIVCDRSCVDQISQIPGSRRVSEVPLICITDEEEAPDPGRYQIQYSSLTAPVKPARLRALILHLLMQKDETDSTD